MHTSLSRGRVLAGAGLVATAVVLAGCQTDGVDVAKAMRPLSSEMLAEIENKGMTKDSPILVRLFKEEAELEVWKQDRTGRFALLKTYPICRWSGELGPKIKEGDRQAPEGFYSITPAQMNPNSSYYLSFNLGYPNAFDRANGRTGSFLMVHGACSSAGCYSMTNEQIGEIYALGREAFFGGQSAFQVQAYPFRMTALNFARHRNNPNLPFWRMIKKGNDLFEVTRQQPKIDVCDRRYVFNAEPPEGSTALRFNPAGRCPAYRIDPDVAAAVAEKERRDSVQTAEYVARGTPVAPIKTGRDGGMNPLFVAELNPQQVQDENGNVRWVVDPAAAASIRAGSYTSSYASLARAPEPQPELAIAVDVPLPRPSPLARHTASAGSGLLSGTRQPVGVASLVSVESNPSAADRPSQGFFGRVGSRVSRWIGLDKDEQKPRPAAQPRAAAPPRAAPHPAAAAAVPKPQPRPEAEEAHAAAKPAPTATITTGSVTLTPVAQPIVAPRVPSLVPGAQPAISADSFDNRWAIRR